MEGILERVARSMTFMRVECLSDVYAIEIARRLEDVAFLHRYQRYTRKLPLPSVLDAHRCAAARPTLQHRAEQLKATCDALLRGEEAHA